MTRRKSCVLVHGLEDDVRDLDLRDLALRVHLLLALGERLLDPCRHRNPSLSKNAKQKTPPVRATPCVIKVVSTVLQAEVCPYDSDHPRPFIMSSSSP